MPPVAITNVMPIAITPTTLAWVSMLRTLSQVGNVSGFEDRAATNISTTTIASAYSWSSKPPITRRQRPIAAAGAPGRHLTSSTRVRGIGGRDGVAKQLALARVLALDLRDDLALAHHEDAGADAHELLELGRHDQHADARLGEVGDHPVELGLGRHVHAARRLVEQQHPAVAQQPAREHDLLLVPAREVADDPVGVVGHGVQRAQLLAAASRARRGR